MNLAPVCPVPGALLREPWVEPCAVRAVAGAGQPCGAGHVGTPGSSRALARLSRRT